MLDANAQGQDLPGSHKGPDRRAARDGAVRGGDAVRRARQAVSAVLQGRSCAVVSRLLLCRRPGETGHPGRDPGYFTFRLNFHHFDRFELDLRRHIHVRGATFSCLRLKLADMVLI